MNEHVSPMAEPSIGHNAANLTLSVELRLFNRVYRRFGGGVMVRCVELPVGTTLGELVAQAGIPELEVFIAFINGTDASVGPGALERERALEEGDVVALSGPVPYSWGYGAPVV